MWCVLEFVLAQTTRWGKTWSVTFCSDTICGVSTEGKKPAVSTIITVCSLWKEKIPRKEVFSVRHLYEVRNSDAVDKRSNSDRSQTLYSAYKSCKRAKVFNNAACVSTSACRRGQCGRERVAWSSVTKRFNISVYGEISGTYFFSWNLVSCNQTKIDLFFC